MPSEFTEWEHEPEAEPASARGGGPPRERIGVGVLDPLGPPVKPSGAWSVWERIFAAAVLAAVLAGLVMLWSHR